MTTPSTPREVDEAASICAALMVSWLNGDREGAELLLDGVDQWAVLGMMTSLAARFGVELAGGREEFARVLVSWTPGQEINWRGKS